ncbi:hypothetical protein [Maribellus sediminis]|uniref:hypothetical protein n=1 Tax=Maribellus sediminis TaxID=2696285 RepID=UPI00142F93CC|nr:hypothetical protein [Maribellus sediminis]
MIEHVHNHITSELQQNTKTDIIFILSAIVLNLIILAVNSGFANNQKKPDTSLLIMFLFVTLLILLNLVVIFGLLKGKQTRSKLINGLIKMYEDENVAKYYDQSLLSNYNTRYNLFMMVVVLTGIIAIVVPFVMR